MSRIFIGLPIAAALALAAPAIADDRSTMTRPTRSSSSSDDEDSDRVRPPAPDLHSRGTPPPMWAPTDDAPPSGITRAPSSSRPTTTTSSRPTTTTPRRPPTSTSSRPPSSTTNTRPTTIRTPEPVRPPTSTSTRPPTSTRPTTGRADYGRPFGNDNIHTDLGDRPGTTSDRGVVVVDTKTPPPSSGTSARPPRDIAREPVAPTRTPTPPVTSTRTPRVPDTTITRPPQRDPSPPPASTRPGHTIDPGPVIRTPKAPPSSTPPPTIRVPRTPDTTTQTYRPPPTVERTPPTTTTRTPPVRDTTSTRPPPTTERPPVDRDLADPPTSYRPPRTNHVHDHDCYGHGWDHFVVMYPRAPYTSGYRGVQYGRPTTNESRIHLDRDQDYHFNVTAGITMLHSGYRGGLTSPGGAVERWSDPGAGLAVEWMPAPPVGLQLSLIRYDDSFVGEAERMHTAAQGSVIGYLAPESPVTPYVLGGATHQGRRIDDQYYDGSNFQRFATNQPVSGPHMGVGLEFRPGPMVIELEGRGIAYMNAPADEPALAGAWQTTLAVGARF